ncbi:MAG: AAA family ATPase [Acidobacteria bacterium]|nr:AAA family ATPase [Acidobacteriota bacterium]
MLHRFRVSNFKSLVNAEFRPAGINLVVGPNNAGKTNLCHALRFLALATRTPLDEAARLCTAEPWNLLNVYSGADSLELEANCTLTSEAEELNFGYTLRLSGPKTTGARGVSRPFAVCSELLRVTGVGLNDRVLLENTAGKVRLFHEQSHDPDPYLQTSAPNTATMLCRLYDLETNRLANLFKRYLGSWGYYNFDPLQLRSNLATPMDRALEANGANLCSVLYTLHNERPRVERTLVEAAKLVEPRLDLISFQAPDPDHVYMFFEDKAGHRFGVQNLSDGTLRFLAMCYLIVAHRQEGSSTPGPPVIVIEEPENGIFVGHLKSLFERIDPSGKQGQFVFTSHNPYFIDLFDGSLDGLVVVKQATTHSVVLPPDREKVQELLGKFSLGELHFRGLLE